MKAAPPAAVDARLDWPAELLREIDLYASRPELDPWRPRRLADFEAAGWRALLMEDLGSSLLESQWSERTIAAVAAGLAAMHAATAARGFPLVHNDVRSDNLFLCSEGSLRLVDWAEAGPGTGLEDAVYWAVGVQLEGGGSAAGVLATYAAAAGDGDPQRAGDVLTRLRRLNLRRMSDPRLPDRVRRLRRRELAVLSCLASSLTENLSNRKPPIGWR
jgi:aminoglycoside phosphotransferase (APT) family kinase protein